MQVRVVTQIHPSEVRERVEAALTAFLPDASLVEEGGELVATGADLSVLRHRIWELRIIDAVRGAMHPHGPELLFVISKQAALGGKVSIPARPQALGELAWTILVEDGDRWADGEALMWWLCPETADGEIVGPID